MKIVTTLMGTLLALGALPAMAADTGDKGVYYYSADQVKAVSQKDPHAPGSSSNGPAGTLGNFKDNSGKFQVTIRRHDEANEPEVHKDHYHIFYVTEGKCTFVTGGKLVGKVLEGGRTWNLDKGSIIVVPTGVMHWFKDVPSGSPWIAFGVEVKSDSGFTGL
jgi:quercetin dioxygenase-like cupin family protein